MIALIISELKTINHFITPMIRQLLTDCIKTNTIPPYFKQASITPRMKKSNININGNINIQLLTLAKIFVRIISNQLTNHLNNNTIFDKYQS